MPQPAEVLYASKQYQEWLSTLKERAMLETQNQSQAMMRAVMHELRRYMMTTDVLTFANAMPPLPRGIFIENWEPNQAPPSLASAEQFTQRVFERLTPHFVPPDSIARDVFEVWAQFLSPLSARQIKSVLPEPLGELWPERPIPYRKSAGSRS